MMNVFGNKIRALVILLSVCTLNFVSAEAEAVGTRHFVINTHDSFEDGDLKGVAIGSDDTVRAGLILGDTPIADASSVWSSLVLPDGSVLLGTGTGGRIYRVKAGKVSIAAETGAMAVSALSLGFGGDVIAGSFPDGQLFRVAVDKLDGSELKPWVELPDTEDIWALAFDAKAKALYAATGPEGKLFRLNANGKAQVYFDSEEDHLVSLALAGDGSVYTGSNGNALLFKLSGPGRATVVHDFVGDDVKAIAIVPASAPSHAGAVYAIANSYNSSRKGLRPAKRAKLSSGSPSTSKPNRPGKGKLMRFTPGGVAELMLSTKRTHLVSLALDDAGTPHVGTGAEGRVFTVSDNHVEQLVVDTDERQVGALVVAGKTRFVATSDPVVFHPITGKGGADAVWTSHVLDAGLRAHFGLLKWTVEGALDLQTRSGNTDEPDKTWSTWSAAMAKPAKVKSAAARYLQVRAKWSRDPNAILREVDLAFLTDNARALLTSVKVGKSRDDTGGSRVPSSGAAPDSPSTKLKLSWKVDNPDRDKLRYRMMYQPVASKRWLAILDSDTTHTKTSYSWDTAGLPEGRYRLRVDASDEMVNPPGRVTRHSLGSQVFVIDNTAPQLTKLTLVGNRLKGTAVDGIGPIAAVEVRRMGSKNFVPVFPTDQVFDERTESFDVDLSSILPPGGQLLVVRAYDSAGNRVERTASR